MQPKQHKTAIPTGTATSRVLAKLMEPAEFLAGLKGGGDIVVDSCRTTWLRGVPNPKTYLSTATMLI